MTFIAAIRMSLRCRYQNVAPMGLTKFRTYDATRTNNMSPRWGFEKNDLKTQFIFFSSLITNLATNLHDNHVLQIDWLRRNWSPSYFLHPTKVFFAPDIYHPNLSV